MPSNIILPDDPNYHEDLEAEIADERYNRALKRITVSDVLSVIDDMVRTEADERKHPLFHLVRHSLNHGTVWTSGKRCHFAEILGAAYEDMIEQAIERLIAEELANFGPWEEEPCARVNRPTTWLPPSPKPALTSSRSCAPRRSP